MRSKSKKLLSVPGGQYAYTWANALFFKVCNITSSNFIYYLSHDEYHNVYYGMPRRARKGAFFTVFLNPAIVVGMACDGPCTGVLPGIASTLKSANPHIHGQTWVF